MKLSPLLIPLLFLSSCTIDWNDEKDAKIVELKNQIENLTTTSKNLVLSGSICQSQLNECKLVNQEKSNGSQITLGSGFTLSQTNDETSMSYSGKIIKTWSHIPPKQVPFVWDEACTSVWKGFENLSPSEKSTGKQGVWDALTDSEKRVCIKESLLQSIRIEQKDVRFFEIIRTQYETYEHWIYDTQSGNLQLIPSMGEPNNQITQ